MSGFMTISSGMVIPLSLANFWQESPCAAFTQWSNAPQGLFRSEKSGVRALRLAVDGGAVRDAWLSWKRVASDAIAKVRMRHVWIKLFVLSELRIFEMVDVKPMISRGQRYML